MSDATAAAEILAKAIDRLAEAVETASENIERGMIHFKSR